MIKKYILCRGSNTKQDYSNNIVKITRNNNVETIYINSGPEDLLNIDTNLLITDGNLIISNNELLNSGTQINFTGISDASTPPPGMLDDANVPIPMGGMTFNFYGTNAGNNMYWNSNCAITIGAMPAYIVSISHNTIPAILLGNYDRILKKLSYINTTNSKFSITTLYPHFYNYYTDNTNTAPFYKWRIRLIKENINSKRQFIEVCVGPTSITTPGYSSAIRTYPSGLDIFGNPQDTNGLPIDQTKNSPFNITNGTSFVNLCGSTFGVTSPAANTSFVFSSDSTGTNWVFTNNAFVNV
jgi:hypothetical protein